MSNKKGKLDFSKIFPEMGMEFTGRINEAGLPIVKNSESGQEGAYDLNLIRDEVINSVNANLPDDKKITSLDELDIQFNSPKDAVPISPASLGQRFKLKAAAYTPKGLMNKLKKEYEAVSYDEDKGIVVKEQGVWRDFDPTVFQTLSGGDGWQVAEAIKEAGIDLAEGLPGFGARTAAGVAGAAKGAAVGSLAGPAGTIAGTIAGGAAGIGAVAAADTVTGRLMGTYEATAGEQVADITLETVLSAAGYAVPFAAKPAKDLFVQAFRKIGKSAAKGPVSQWMAAMTDKPAVVMERLFNKPKLINGMIDATKGKSTTAAKDMLDKKAQSHVKTIMSNVQKGISKEFETRETAFLAALGDDFTANLQPQMFRTMEKLQTGNGLGLVRLNTAIKPGAGSVSPGQGGIPAGTREFTGFRPVSFDEFRELMGPTLPALTLRKAYKGLTEITRQATNVLRSGKKTSGKDILKFRRELDNFVYNTRVMADDEVGDMIKPVAKEFRDSLVNTFKARPAANKIYNEMNQFYRQGLDDAVAAGKLLKGTKFERDARTLSFINGLANKDTSLPSREFLSRASKYAFKDDLMAERTMDTVAAKAFLPWLERAGFSVGAISIGTGAVAGGSVGGLPGLALGTGVGLAAASPRVAARSVKFLAPNKAKALLPYSKILMKSVKNMSQEAKDELLVNPAILGQMFNQTVEAASNEDQQVLQLLQQTGALQSGQ